MFEFEFTKFDFRDFMDFILNLADRHGLGQVRFNPERRELFDNVQLTHISPTRDVEDSRGFTWAWSKVQDKVRRVSFNQFSKDETKSVYISIDLDKKTIKLNEARGISPIIVEELAKKRFGQGVISGREQIIKNQREDEILKLSPEFHGIGVDLKALYRNYKNKPKPLNSLSTRKTTNRSLSAKYWWALIIPVLAGVLIYLITEGVLSKLFERFSIPSFQYGYSETEKLFFVTEPSDTQIVKADWTFASKWTHDKSPSVSEFTIINEFPSKLSRGMLFDFLSSEAGLNSFTKFGKDVLECVLLPYSKDGIPALIAVTYKYKNQQPAKTKDLVLITRLDTPHPEIIDAAKNVSKDSDIFEFFDQHLFYLNSAFEQVNELKNSGKNQDNYSGQLRINNGECGFRLNQPIRGY